MKPSRNNPLLHVISLCLGGFECRGGVELRLHRCEDRPAELMMLERLCGVCCDKATVINNVFRDVPWYFRWILEAQCTV